MAEDALIGGPGHEAESRRLARELSRRRGLV